jgi:hypothetical protein
MGDHDAAVERLQQVLEDCTYETVERVDWLLSQVTYLDKITVADLQVMVYEEVKRREDDERTR